jgi:outer membrane protein
VTSGQQELDLVQAQVKVGTVAAANIYQAQATLATAQVTLSQDQGNVVTASATLKNALGVDSTEVVQPVPLAAGDQLPPPPPTDGEKTLDEYLRIAYANRPDLREQQATVEYDNLNVKLAQISAGLQGAATYEFLYTPVDNYNMPFTTGTDSRWMATATYPLFDGGYSRAAVRIAQAERDAARDTLEQQRQAVHLAVEQALTDRTQAATSANLAQVGLKAAQVNYDSEVAQQKEGLATVIDVTTAQVTLVQAQDQYVSAIYQFYVADSALRRAIGQNQITASCAAAP